MEDAIENGKGRQDIPYKILIPRKDRLKALKGLYEYNLFESEESLMNLLAFREMRMNL